MADIEIGKFTLESLTTGMYKDPEIVYREYIQNAVDSFDEAVSSGILKAEDCRIEVIVNENRNEISIKDNGTGIRKNLARKTLLDIGNSTKAHSNNRGFRGIGRLGGLSYCKRLSFCTSFQGETEKTTVSFDCEKLKKFLVPGQANEHTLQSIIVAVTEVKVTPEQASAHYFIVKMEGVDDISSLLDIGQVRDYISQSAPVPFRDKFYWNDVIKKEFAESSFQIAEYAIFLGDSFETLSQVFKPYKISFDVSARTGITKDEIQNISFFKLETDSELLAVGWYAETNFYGTVADDRMAGIRVRQGNILIGDASLIAPYFVESRFNNWCIGEMYILSNNLIPNARRDSFENNATFVEFGVSFRKSIGVELTNKIRTASKIRNNPQQKVLRKTKKTLQDTQRVLDKGFNSLFEKEQVTKALDTARRELYIIPKNAHQEVLAEKSDLMTQITDLSAEVKESKNYKVRKDITSNFSKEEKKIIQAMLEVLTRNFEREIVDELYEEFLKQLKRKD